MGTSTLVMIRLIIPMMMPDTARNTMIPSVKKARCQVLVQASHSSRQLLLGCGWLLPSAILYSLSLRRSFSSRTVWIRYHKPITNMTKSGSSSRSHMSKLSRNNTAISRFDFNDCRDTVFLSGVGDKRLRSKEQSSLTIFIIQ
jgi:hypothetical protein